MTSPNTPLSILAKPFDNIDGLEKVLGLMWKVAILYGGVWIFHYCYVGIGYTPVGLSVGDGVYWLFLSAAIGTTALVLALTGAFSLWPYAGVLNLSRALTPSSMMVFGGPWRHVVAHHWRAFWLRPIDKPTFKFAAALVCLLFSLAVLALVAWYRFVDSHLLGDELLKYTLWAGCAAYFVFAMLSHWWGRKADAGISFGLASMATTGYVALVLAISHAAGGFVVSVLVGGICMMLLVHMVKQPLEEVPYWRLMVWVFAFIIFLGPLYLSPAFPNQGTDRRGHNFMSQQVFRQLGLSHVDVSVVLKGDAARMVEKLIEQEALSAMTCKLEGDALQVSGIDVPWNGLGTKTLLSFPAPMTKAANDKGEGITTSPTRLAVDSDQVFVLSEARTRCADLPTAVYFPSGKAVTSNREAIDKLRQELTDMQALAGRDAAWKVDKFIVEAHADPMPLGRSSNGNDDLARARTEHVLHETAFKAILGPDGPQPSVDIHVEGSRHPEKGSCGMRGEPAALAECEAVNRRVQVRVLWRSSPRVAATP